MASLGYPIHSLTPISMRYKVEFEDNIPIRAILIKMVNRINDITDFGEVNGRTVIKFLFVEAENEKDALQQAQRIVTTIFRF
jgi:hypothetical protein